MECADREAIGLPRMDEAKCLAHIDGCIREGFALLVEAGEFLAPVGTLLGVRYEMWFRREPIASDLFTYVLPEWRRKGVGLTLYRRFRSWRKEHGLKLCLGQVSGIEVERMEKLFAHLGMRKAGATYFEA